MSIIITKGSATMVDHNNYDLTLEQAAMELFYGANVIALEYEDFEDEFSFPCTDTLKASDFKGLTHDEIIDKIRCYYESFGRVKTN